MQESQQMPACRVEWSSKQLQRCRTQNCVRNALFAGHAVAEKKLFFATKQFCIATRQLMISKMTIIWQPVKQMTHTFKIPVCEHQNQLTHRQQMPVNFWKLSKKYSKFSKAQVQNNRSAESLTNNSNCRKIKLECIFFSKRIMRIFTFYSTFPTPAASLAWWACSTATASSTYTTVYTHCHQTQTQQADGRHDMPPPLQVDNIFVFIRQVAPIPACWLFKTSTSWPLTLKLVSELRVTWATSVPF